MSIQIHRFQEEINTREFPQNENGEILAVDVNHNSFWKKKCLQNTVSFFQPHTPVHRFPTPRAKMNACFFTMLPTEQCIEIQTCKGLKKCFQISEFLLLINDHDSVLLKSFHPDSEEKSKGNSHWGIIPIQTMTTEKFIYEVELFMCGFSVCSMVAEGEVFDFSQSNLEDEEYNTVIEAFHFAKDNNEHPTNTLYFVACFLQEISESHSDVVFMDILQENPWHALWVFRLLCFCIFQDDIPSNLETNIMHIVDDLEELFHWKIMDYAPSSIPHLKITFGTNYLSQQRVGVKFKREVKDPYFESSKLLGIESKYLQLEDQISSSALYIFSIQEGAIHTKLSSTEITECILSNDNIISIGYCDSSQTLIVPIERHLELFSNEATLSFALRSRVNRYIMDEVQWLSPAKKQFAWKQFVWLLGPFIRRENITNTGTFYCFVFDDGSIKLGKRNI